MLIIIRILGAHAVQGFGLEEEEEEEEEER
jgi:hypothetical protein